MSDPEARLPSGANTYVLAVDLEVALRKVLKDVLVPIFEERDEKINARFAALTKRINETAAANTAGRADLLDQILVELQDIKNSILPEFTADELREKIRLFEHVAAQVQEIIARYAAQDAREAGGQ